MQKSSAAKWMAVNVFIWDGIVIALRGCNGFPSFAALYFIFGCLESCATPAILLLTSMWYKVRSSYFGLEYGPHFPE